ncbi:MAG: hypothetical protein JOZ69_04570 [Myxococcales bacterium]|nr:hypothetical protein [Myxococcales bacterium]
MATRCSPSSRLVPRSYRFFRLPIALALGLPALVAFPARAQADACAVDADCGHGFTCQVVGGTACAGVACKPGDECPAPPPCEPTVVKGCVPDACTSNSDCATDMVCVSSTSTTCSGGSAACPPNTQCPPPPPPDCTTQTTSQCEPRYLADCKVDSDCGTGFTCVAEQACGCAGSGGASMGAGIDGSAGGSGGSSNPAMGAPTPAPSPAVDGGAAPPPQRLDASPADSVDASPPDCTCTPTGHGFCQLQPLPCNTAADCPSGGWTCEPAATPAAVCGAPVSVDGAAFGCDPPSPASSGCVPPYWNTPLANGHTAGATSGDLGAPGRGNSGTGGAPATPPTASGDGPTSASGSNGGTASKGMGGCAVSPGPTTPGGLASLALGVFSVLGLTARRRRSGRTAR